MAERLDDIPRFTFRLGHDPEYDAPCVDKVPTTQTGPRAFVSYIDHSTRIAALEAQLAEATRRNRELEREVTGINHSYFKERAARVALEARLAEAMKALDALLDLNDNGGPFGGELYQDRVDRAWEAAHRVREGGKVE